MFDQHQLFGDDCAPGLILNPKAQTIIRLLDAHHVQGYRLIATKRSEAGLETIIVRVHTSRPQKCVHPLKAVEPIALLFQPDAQPCVFALREDFPDTPHQLPGYDGNPISLCIDDRPWSEAKASWTPVDFLVRIQEWLSKTARGELHGQVRAPEPLFVNCGPIFIVPRSILEATFKDAQQLKVYVVGQNPNLEILSVTTGALPQGCKYVPINMIALTSPSQSMMRLRFPPRTLGELAKYLVQINLDIIQILKDHLQRVFDEAWSKENIRTPKSLADPATFASRLAIIIAFPIEDEGGTTTKGLEVRGFLTSATLAEIGVDLGLLLKSPDGVHGRSIVPSPQCSLDSIALLTCQVQLGLDRALATMLSGIKSEEKSAVTLIGAGSIGSHVSTVLAREGLFEWTIVDCDHFLPHNAVRHTLTNEHVGNAKALSLSRQLEVLLAEPDAANAIVGNVLDQNGPNQAQIISSLESADLIFDGSASIAVSRRIADAPVSNARRISFFFNPEGSDSVLMVEPKARDINLRELEAQYYRTIVVNSALDGHLKMDEARISYAGSCRQATNRMPESRVAALSAVIANEIPDSLIDENGRVVVWRYSRDGISCLRAVADKWHQFETTGWQTWVSAEIVSELHQKRESKLPSETGGVLMGVVDTDAKIIHVCVALNPPPDSHGSPSHFERGIVGLAEEINQVAKKTGGQLTYLGEWHSHPVSYLLISI